MMSSHLNLNKRQISALAIGGVGQTSIVSMNSSNSEGKPTSKRRKTRKGTHSCWECKRRKERCQFSPETSDCVNCQKRGTACISQEFVDHTTSLSKVTQSVGDARRLESLLHQVLERLDGRLLARSANLPEDIKNAIISREAALQQSTSTSDTGVSTTLRSSLTALEDQDNDDYTTLVSSKPQHGLANRKGRGSRLEQLSQTLYSMLPSREDMEIICYTTKRYMMRDVLINPYDDTDTDPHKLTEDLSNYPASGAHPILMARHLLRVATHLQQYDHEIVEETKLLSAPINMLRHSYAEAASKILCQDRLLGSIESLQCMMMLAIYECNSGNIRLSWMYNRRAITIAQMNGLHLPEGRQPLQTLDQRTQLKTTRAWLQLNHFDRIQSLLLGLPMAIDAINIADDADFSDEMPLVRLGRMHCSITAEVLKRNASDNQLRTFAVTQALDQGLAKAATILPGQWWLMPTFGAGGWAPIEIFRDVRRVAIQMLHYHLISQLHLPFVLQSSTGSSTEHSKMACVDATREVLTRFAATRATKREIVTCRVMDFMAFTSAITLALVYLSGRTRSIDTTTWPAHRHHSDWAMIKQVQECMVELSKTNDHDPQAAQMAEVLAQLLRIESIAADGYTVTMKHIKFGNAAVDRQKEGNVLHLLVPYFGNIVIMLGEPASQPALTELPKTSMQNMPMTASDFFEPKPELEPFVHAPEMHGVHSDSWDPKCGKLPAGDEVQLGQMQDFPASQTMPNMTADGDDWLLQGVDTTLFSNLFGQVGDDWSHKF